MTTQHHAGITGRALLALARGGGRLLIGTGALVLLSVLLVGLPWGLIHYIGWPLPDHLPSLAEATTWLWRGSFHTGTLLDILAVACWILWGFFVVDVTGCLADAVTGIRRPGFALPPGPMHLLASLLVGGLLLALLGHRTPAIAAVLPAGHATAAPVVATAPPTAGLGGGHPTVTVAEPAGGVHDSLWRIAERHLGDGHRWPEIWHLNQGRTQNDGRVFTDPDLIYSGWTLLLPATGHDADHPASSAERPEPSRSPAEPSQREAGSEATAPPPEATATATPAEDADESASPGGGEAVDLGNGVFLSLAVAAAISAALVLARHRYRRRWAPGRSSYAPMPVAPTVYELRLAHLTAACDGVSHPGEGNDGEQCGEHPRRGLVLTPPGAEDPADGEPDRIALGVRDGVSVASTLARRGLGFTGPTAAAAARAVLIAQLASETTQVVVPVDDLPLLLEDPPDRLPTALRIVPDFAAALAELDAATTDRKWRLLVARPPATQSDTARLRALLASGASNASAILLGQYLPGATIYVAEDGTVSASSPGAATELRDTRMFTATPPAITELLGVLSDADVSLEPRRPADRGTELDGEPVTAPPGLACFATSATREKPAADTDRPDDSTQTPGATVAAELAPPPELRLTVLGAFTATMTTPDGEHRRPRLGMKAQELLTYLAIHRSGVSRDILIADLWRECRHRDRRTNNLNSALRRLRDALDTTNGGARPDIVLTGDGRLRLNPDCVSVDYWDFDDARTLARAAATDDQRHHACRAQVAAYGGRLGADLDAAEWVHGPDYNTQCAVVDALGRLAAAAETTDPQHALDLLDTARGYDPGNESLYGAIMRLQSALGYHDAIDRTLSLLEAELAAHKDKPSPEIVGLARSLRRRHTTTIATQTPGYHHHGQRETPRGNPASE